MIGHGHRGAHWCGEGRPQGVGRIQLRLVSTRLVRPASSHERMIFVQIVQIGLNLGQGSLQRTEPVGKVRTVLQGFELGFGVSIQDDIQVVVLPLSRSTQFGDTGVAGDNTSENSWKTLVIEWPGVPGSGLTQNLDDIHQSSH